MIQLKVRLFPYTSVSGALIDLVVQFPSPSILFDIEEDVIKLPGINFSFILPQFYNKLSLVENRLRSLFDDYNHKKLLSMSNQRLFSSDSINPYFDIRFTDSLIDTIRSNPNLIESPFIFYIDSEIISQNFPNLTDLNDVFQINLEGDSYFNQSILSYLSEFITVTTQPDDRALLLKQPDSLFDNPSTIPISTPLPLPSPAATPLISFPTLTLFIVPECGPNQYIHFPCTLR